jgi:hypothetical protein
LRLNGRGCAGTGASGIAAIIYGWIEKSPRNDLVIADLRFTHLPLKGANVCNQCLDVSVGKLAAEWFHGFLPIRLYAFLDRSFRFGIAERSLHFGVMIVFHPQFFPHHGVSAASFPWQEAQFCAHVALTLAAAATPADAITIAARTNNFRFIEIRWSASGDLTSMIQSKTKKNLFLERANVSDKRFDFVVGQLSAERLHGRLATLLNAFFD